MLPGEGAWTMGKGMGDGSPQLAGGDGIRAVGGAESRLSELTDPTTTFPTTRLMACTWPFVALRTLPSKDIDTSVCVGQCVTYFVDLD